MKRRIFLFCIILGLLLMSSFIIVVKARDLALTATMSATPSPIPFAEANFSGTPLSGTEPLTVQFTHLYTSTNSPILNCTWTFGDGTTQSMNGPFTTCPSVSHIYAAGNFTVKLSVTITDIVFNVTKANYIQVTPVGGWTPTRTSTPGCGSVIVVTSTFTPTASPTLPTAPTPTKTATSCGAIFITATPDAPTLTPQGPLPDLVVLSITETIVPNPTATLKPNGCTSTNTGTRYVIVRFQNIGAGDAGAFVVGLNSSQQTVSGLAAGQTSSVSFLAPFTNRTATVDATNLVAESNESNNSLTVIITAGPTTTGTAPATVCVTLTPSKTWTPVLTSTLTRTPTRTSTPTIGPSLTSTPTSSSTCSPVTSTITAPFTWDGAGTYCWQSSNLGSYINNWNNTSVTLNSLNITNLYIPASSYPAKINGFWYVGYSSSVAWGHFEAK
jgi:PKD repeat protein